MVKRGKKRQILTQLFNQGYDPKTAKAYLKSPEGITKYGETKISRGFYYNVYRELKQDKVTSGTGETAPLTSTSQPEGVTAGKGAPLKIKVGGEPTPPEQLKIIQAGQGIGATPSTIMTGETLGGFFKSIAFNYPEKHRWDDKASNFLGSVWAPIYNKWITASSENFLLGFAVICTLVIVVKPTILTIRDWREQQQIKKGGKSRREKLIAQEKKA